MDHLDTLAAELSAVLGVFADVRVSASLVILALVLWLGGKVVMAERARAAARDAASSAADAAADPASTTPPQEGTSVTDTSSASAPTPEDHTDRGPAPSDAGAFRIRWDRTGLFLAAVALAVAFLVSGVAAAFGAGTTALAGWSLLGVLAAVAGLRVLAVRDLRARRAARAAQAEARPVPSPVAGNDAPAATARAEQEAAASISAEAPAPATVDPATAAPSLPAAPASATDAAEHQSPAVTETEQDPITVVLPTVPRPTYLDAPEMQRSAPARLDTADKAPSGRVRLADGVSELQRRRTRAQAARPLDLDSVLARRRAS